MGKILKVHLIIRCDEKSCDNILDVEEVLKPLDHDLEYYQNKLVGKWYDLGIWGIYCPDCYKELDNHKPEKKKYELS